MCAILILHQSNSDEIYDEKEDDADADDAADADEADAYEADADDADVDDAGINDGDVDFSPAAVRNWTLCLRSASACATVILQIFTTKDLNVLHVLHINQNEQISGDVCTYLIQSLRGIVKVASRPKSASFIKHLESEK